MPLLSSSYRAPFGLSNGYVQSILPTLTRRIVLDGLEPERIDTNDGDFLDLQWRKVGGDALVLVSHGLEGHANRPYVLGVVREANRQGFDALAWNFRGCGEEINRLPRMYHSGATEDLHRVVVHAVAQGYREIHLVGFSMGGNLSLVYAGREASFLPPEVKTVSAFSVPCDLASSAQQLAKPKNRVFMLRFLRDLKHKMQAKAERFPELVSIDGYDEIRDFQQFDDRYTAPLHGFDDAKHYWQVSSSVRYLENIRVPTLIVNALNDPFLTPECFPVSVAQEHPYVHLEMPVSGGHVGFILRTKDKTYWQEQRALAFIQQHRV